MNNQRRFRRAMVVFAAVAVCLAGCSEDIFESRVASIEGQVVETGSDVPIFGIKIGVLYRFNDVSQSIAPAAVPFPATAEIQNVWPNPVETQDDVSIRLQVSEPTTARVEIRGFELGVTGTIALLHDGPVTADTTVAWDGRDGFTQDLAPNGMYLVRVTSPSNEGDPPEELLLVNRSAVQMEALDAFNTVSGAEGDYFLDDLAVGRSFDRTSPQGDFAGRALVASRVTIVFRDPDYQPKEEVVEIGPNETVVQLTRLTPVISGPRPLPDSE